MTAIKANGIQLEFESFGNSADPAVLLIMGLGMQMIAWPSEFCEALVAAGYRVIRFDNRDIGLSTKCDAAGKPNIALSAIRYWLGLRVRAPYRIEDMADDSVALLDALGIASAHVVGVSMGGMIAQSLASRHPRHCLSLTSIMSSTGRRSLPRPRWDILKLLVARPPRGAGIDAITDHFVRLYRAIGSPGFPTSPGLLRERIATSLQRNYCPAGTARQLLAIVASGDRSQAVAAIRVPTLVVHGDADPLVPLAHGVETARRIVSADLEIVPGMGHDLPAPLLPILAELLLTHWRKLTVSGR